MTAFIIEHQCPQCGAPAELEETDRLFRCGFCRVASYLTTPGLFRYVIPHKAPAGRALFYFPYWRFKGMLFYCLGDKIDKRFADVSHQAVSSLQFPVSLGLRGQTQKLRFAATDMPGVFIKPRTDSAVFLSTVCDRFGANLPKPILHQAQIGETLSMVYAPFYQGDALYDAVLNQPTAADDPAAVARLVETGEAPLWPITFIAALCPQCGWDLEGERDSLTLTCANCATSWWTRRGRLETVKTAFLPTDGKNDTSDTIYMPFWRIHADVSPIDLKTYADLIKTANLAKVPRPGWDQAPLRFWSPAFKVRPHSLLTYASTVTLNQPLSRVETGLPPKGRLQAVNMPLQEAVESLKLILAGFMRPRERMIEYLPHIKITARSFLLVYIPFREDYHEFIHDGMRMAIPKKTLEHARNL